MKCLTIVNYLCLYLQPKITRKTLTGCEEQGVRKKLLQDLCWYEVIWEGLRKRDFALDWMLSGSKNNSTIEYFNKSYLEGGKIKSRLKT